MRRRRSNRSSGSELGRSGWYSASQRALVKSRVAWVPAVKVWSEGDDIDVVLSCETRQPPQTGQVGVKFGGRPPQIGRV